MTSPSVPGRLDGITPVPSAVNEPVFGYAPGSPERAEVESTLRSLAAEKVDLTCTIDGKQRMGGGEAFNVVQPHAHQEVLGRSEERRVGKECRARGGRGHARK